VADALKLTGYFMERHLLGPRDLTMPEGRSMILERLKQAGIKSDSERDDAGQA
jgi:hypothetical protein